MIWTFVVAGKFTDSGSISAFLLEIRFWESLWQLNFNVTFTKCPWEYKQCLRFSKPVSARAPISSWMFLKLRGMPKISKPCLLQYYLSPNYFCSLLRRLFDSLKLTFLDECYIIFHFSDVDFKFVKNIPKVNQKRVKFTLVI